MTRAAALCADCAVMCGFTVANDRNCAGCAVNGAADRFYVTRFLRRLRHACARSRMLFYLPSFLSDPQHGLSLPHARAWRNRRSVWSASYFKELAL